MPRSSDSNKLSSQNGEDSLDLRPTCHLAPCGYIQTSEVLLLVGLQLLNVRWQEAKLLRAALAFEAATDWQAHMWIC